MTSRGEFEVSEVVLQLPFYYDAILENDEGAVPVPLNSIRDQVWQFQPRLAGVSLSQVVAPAPGK